jgi:tetratricopeptide (TPR) repeat protein
VASAAVLVLSLHASSRLVEQTDPELALSLFPLNVDATTNLIENMLDGERPATDFLGVRSYLDDSLRWNMGHARLHSLRAEVLLRVGNRSGAIDGFEHALQLSKTESVALQRMIAWSIERQDVAGALLNIDLLLRRHPAKLNNLGGVFPALAATREGYEELRGRLLTTPPWRAAAFRQLAAEPASLAAGASLLIDLREAGNPLGEWEVSIITQALIREGRTLEAYNLFLATLSDEEAALGGYIHDAGFERKSSSKPFDWQIRGRSGHTINRLPHPAFVGERSGLLIQFNGTPVKDMHVRQVLHLPPGHFDLGAEVSAANAKLPKGLYWSLRCVSSGRELARLDIPEGSYRDEEVSTSFELPPVDCPLQVISIHTAVIAESWKDRYSGNVVIRRLQIRKGIS